jgi:DNA-binding PadR family transcriptional regulator
MHGHACPPPWTMRLMAMRGGRGRRGDWTAYGRGPGAGFGMWGAKGPHWGGRKAGRGAIRAAILELLAEEPMHGYQIMQELAERTGGMWRPSPGSIYPTLQQLADEGLVMAEDSAGKKVYSLTEEGRATVEAQAIQVGAAVMQVATAGNEEQLTEAKEILADTRSRLYRILADDESS